MASKNHKYTLLNVQNDDAEIDLQFQDFEQQPSSSSNNREAFSQNQAVYFNSFPDSVDDDQEQKLIESDQDLYKNFPLVISERWQQEVAETVFDTVNLEADKMELKRKAKHKHKFDTDEKESDCIIHGYIKKLGGPFASAWQTRYAKLYPNRVELHSESGSGKPELIFMDQIENISSEYVKGENCIIIKIKDSKITLTNPDEIGLKEWTISLRSAHKMSLELLSNMAKKAGKIYGTDSNNKAPLTATRNGNNGNGN